MASTEYRYNKFNVQSIGNLAADSIGKYEAQTLQSECCVRIGYVSNNNTFTTLADTYWTHGGIRVWILKIQKKVVQIACWDRVHFKKV